MFSDSSVDHYCFGHRFFLQQFLVIVNSCEYSILTFHVRFLSDKINSSFLIYMMSGIFITFTCKSLGNARMKRLDF